MNGNILEGKIVAEKIKEELKAKLYVLKEKGILPGLAVILVGDNPASRVYVGHKEKACKEIGFYSEVYRLPVEITQEELMELVTKLKNDTYIHGILVQLPLPGHLDEKQVLNHIPPDKDVDGFHPINVGALMVGQKGLQPCTPKGCLRLLKETGVELDGKKAVIVGRSNIVGKPLALMLLQENATVTICHSRTKDLIKEVSQADIVVAAVGKANFIGGEMIKTGAVVIDVGINRLDNGKLAGDVDYDAAMTRAGWITPVPGGVGPMTIAMLLQNTLEACMNQIK